MSSAVRIAVVDDDPAVLESICFLLEVCGHSVTTFASGSHFLAATAIGSFDGAILDHHMPALTGLEVARQLRTTGNRLPLMLLSGALTPAISADAAELGIERIVEKRAPDQSVLEFVELIGRLRTRVIS